MNVKIKKGLGRVIAPLALLVMAIAVLFMGGMGFTKAHALVTKAFTNVSISGKMLNYTSTMFANSENKYRLFATTDVNPSTSDIENWNNEFIELNTNEGSWGSTINSIIYKNLFPAAGTYSCVIGHQNNQTGRYSADSAIFQNVIQPLPDAPVKEGHTFVGWYLDEALTQPYDGRPITSDVSLYAKYEINKYSLVLDANGGEIGGLAKKMLTVDWGSTFDHNATVNQPVRAGHTFDGWFFADGTQYHGEVIKENLTLTAKWTINRYTLTYDTNGGAAIAPVTVDWGTTFVVAGLPDAIREGYTFDGWTMADGSYLATTTPITADVTIKARWTINRHTVTYDADGGEIAKASDTVDFGTTVTPPAPTREGYDFLGWFDGETKIEGDYTVKSDVTLKVKWQIKTYTVTFIIDGEVYKTLEVNHGTTFQQAMKEDKELAYMFLLDESGAAIGKGAAITGAVTVPVGEMTTEEKIATFIGNNWWLLWVLGALAVAGIGAAVIASVVAQKRK